MRNYPSLKWLASLTPLQHDQYLKYSKQKQNTRYRNEEWYLTFDEWCVIWSEKWHLRKKGSSGYIMSRQDPSEPWCYDNVITISRKALGWLGPK